MVTIQGLNFNPAFNYAQYAYPTPGSFFQAGHGLNDIGASIYGGIARNSSPLYRNPLSASLVAYNNQYMNPYGNVMAQPYGGFNLANLPAHAFPQAPLGTNGIINSNYISPIGSNLAPLGSSPLSPGGVGYTGTLGESLGFNIGSAYRNAPTASTMNTALLATPYAQMYNDQYNSDSILSNTLGIKSAYNPGVTGKREAAGDPTGLAAKVDKEGAAELTGLIGKYSKFLYG